MLLPQGQKKIRAALLDGQPIDYEIEERSSNHYVILNTTQGFGTVEINLL